MSGALGTDKDVEALARRARRSGWTVSVDGSTHLRWEAPSGAVFRCALTGGRTTRLRVERDLAALDPEHFADLAPATAARSLEDAGLESPAARAAFGEEAAIAADELTAAAEMAQLAAQQMDPHSAAETCHLARAVLRDLEESFRSIARGAMRS
jgi:hypothetical protein